MAIIPGALNSFPVNIQICLPSRVSHYAGNPLVKFKI